MFFSTALLVKTIVGSVAVLTSLRYGTGLYFWRQTELLERPTYTVLKRLSKGVELRQYEPYLIAETIVEMPVEGQSGGGSKRKRPRDPSFSGFGKCAGYIFGKNKARRSQRLVDRIGWFRLGSGSNQTKAESSESMAMTAPVRTATISEKMAMTAPVRNVQSSLDSTKKKRSMKVSFVIGKKYSLQTAPIPLDKKVQLRQVPAHTLAVRTFSGPPPPPTRVEKERELILQVLAEEAPELYMQQKQRLPTASTPSQRRKTSATGAGGEVLVYGYHDPFITPNLLRRNEVALVVEGSA